VDNLPNRLITIDLPSAPVLENPPLQNRTTGKTGASAAKTRPLIPLSHIASFFTARRPHTFRGNSPHPKQNQKLALPLFFTGIQSMERKRRPR
jgi:hypothetical protein